MSKLVIIILSGGPGSRLWPISREGHPKPFIKLSDGQSLFQKTLIRGLTLPNLVEIITVTNKNIFYQSVDDLNEINFPEEKSNLKKTFILEPSAKNTAPAITLAAIDVLNRLGKDTVMLVLPADHLISNQSKFEKAVTEAINLALSGKIVTFGIEPTSPDTGYGYIEADNFLVKRFIEKPNFKDALHFIEAGNFYWNSGMFCFKAAVFLDEIKQHCIEYFINGENCIEQSSYSNRMDYDCLMLDTKTFNIFESNSIDYALLEKSGDIAVVPCSIGWSDVGSWLALTDSMDKNNEENRQYGDALFFETKNSSVWSTNRKVSLLGVKDLIVVETFDSVLVLAKSHAQKVKELYALLKDQEGSICHNYRESRRPWGSFVVLYEGDFFKVKSIKIKPGHQISLQKHNFRSEHWIVVEGTAEVTRNNNNYLLNQNESTYIPIGEIHRLRNPNSSILEIIEVQLGSYLGEDDIFRYDDNYDRQ